MTEMTQLEMKGDFKKLPDKGRPCIKPKSSIRKTRFLSASISVLIALCSQSASALSDTKSKADSAAFAAAAESFIKESLVLSPTNASQAGYHKHKDAKAGELIELDALLDDMSVKGLAEQKAFYESWQEKFRKEFPKDSLSNEDAADRQLIDDQISLQLLELDTIQNYKHNPCPAVELIGSAVFQPLTEDYADKEQRLRHVLSRVSQIPRFLSQVKSYLDDVDPIYVQTALLENEGNIELIEKTLKAEIPEGSQLKADYDKTSKSAIEALKSFSKWLEDDLAKRESKRSWRLGKEFYDKKFRLVMETETQPDALLADAEKELALVRAEMYQLALPLYKKYYPDAAEPPKSLSEHEKENLVISQVLKKISDEHPKRDELQKAIEADLDGIKQFIREHKIVSLSERDNLKVVPTPAFQRGIYSVAGFHSAPPLNPKAEAQYWVTPIDPKTSDADAESRLREYNNFTLKWLTIHEALPGHYIQFEHLNNLSPPWRRLLRSVFGNGAYIEGWAEYIAQVMMDEGYMKDDPRFRMIMRKIRLRLLCNTIIDIKMHCKNMSDEEALTLMTRDAFQTDAEAKGKLRRAKLSSTQLPTYYVGLREWLGLRKRYEAAAGKKFNLLEFHNQALDEGPLPVPVVEKLMLGRL